ncbi:MAG: MFS transporter [Caldilineaceae bacterium]
MASLPHWRRNLYILFSVQILSTAGFSLVFPFLPLYVNELGVASHGSIEFWSGLVFSSQAVTMMFTAPIWGTIADRYGRKPMLIRASLGGAIIVGAMGFAQNAEQLVLLRTIQGLVSGVIAASNALVAASTPREKSGEALGLMQTGTWVGVAIGPLAGGVLGDAFGFRESFWITGTMLGMAAIAVIIWVREDFTPQERKDRPGFLSSYRSLIHAPDMASLYSSTFLFSVARSVTLPIAALFVLELMGPTAAVATVTGMLMGFKAIVGSGSAVWFGRLGDRLGHPRILLFGAILGVLLYIPQPFVTTAWQLVVLQALTGLVQGAMVPAIGALMNLRTPAGSKGAAYGLDNSVNAGGRMIAPLLGAGVAVWLGFRGVFALTGLVYVGSVLVAWHIFRSSQRDPQSFARPIPVEAGD